MKKPEPEVTSLIPIPFHGGVIEAVQDQQGKPWVVLKRICDNLGIADQPQAAKLKSQPWAGTTMIVVPSPGGMQPTFCIDLDTLLMWLATIHASKVRAAARPTLVAYQKEVMQVLRNHFLGDGSAELAEVSKPGDPLDPLCRAAVLDLLTLPGWASRSSRALAKVFKISHTTAAKLRALVPAATPPDRIGLDDRLIDTTNIGGRSTRGEELAAAAEYVAGAVERQMEGLRADLLREVRAQIPAAPDKLYTAKQMCDYLQVSLRRWRELYLSGRLDAAQFPLGDGEDELRWDPAGVLRLLRVKP